MASSIQTYLNNIQNAVYGKDVRSSIHDAIELCYSDVSSGKTIAEEAADSITDAIADATTAANSASAAAADAETAKTAAEEAVESANTAITAANTATTNANAAVEAAESATTAANSAATAANTAATAANDAAEAANTAVSSIASISGDASTALVDITAATANASTAATAANTAASAANTAASNADTKASAAASAANSCTTAAASATTAAANANTAKDAANSAATSANNAAEAANTAATAANDAASAATTAATSANSAVTSLNTKISTIDSKISDAETAVSNANVATVSANAAASSANTAATRANTAAATIEGLTVTYEDVGPSTEASATLQTVDDHKNIHFLLRQGASGTSFIVKGNAYATLAELEADITDPEVGDQYNVGSSAPYNIYRWTGTTWEDQGTIGTSSSSITEITAQDVASIQNGREVTDTTKVLKVAGLTYLLQTLLVSLLNNKVDTVSGKGLSTNDLTDDLLSELELAYSLTQQFLTSKVDVISGKGLSTNDLTDALLAKITLIGSGSLSTTSQELIAAVNELNSSKANIASPTFTGTPAAPTPSSSDSSTRLATTAFVQNQISGVKNLFFTDVDADDWSEDSTYSNYGYRCALTLSGVTSSMFANVVFSPTDVLSGDYAPVCDTYNGGVYVYSKVDTSTTILTIAVFQ